MGTRDSTSTNRRITSTAGAALATIVLGLSACAAGDEDAAATEGTADGTAEGTAMPVDEPALDDAGDASDAAGRGVNAGDAMFDVGAVGRDVITEMRVAMSSEDIRRTVSSITAGAAALGGGVASSDVDYGSPADDAGDDRPGHALLVVRVPPASIDRMLSRLGDAGEVESISQSAQDVTEQLVDLDVRIRNARQSVESVRAFMERTEDLSELVTLEAELSRRQTDLERLEAQRRNLRDRVALSTITIEVRQTSVDPAADDDGTIGDAFGVGWDAFVAAVFTVGFVAAVIAPFIVVVVIVGIGVWLLLRRRPHPRRTVDRHGAAEDEEPARDEQQMTPA